MKFRSLLHMRFGRLTVIADGGSLRRGKVSSHMWHCRCDCGKEVLVARQGLTSGQTASCGCLFSEMMAERNRQHSTHGLSKSKVYHIWRNMHQRCRNPHHTSYSRYGARGIKVCARWASFENFLADMGQPPDDSYTLDRINTQGNYEPGNCRWATPRQQANNRNSNRYLEYGGQRRTLSEWAAITGIHPKSLSKRLEYGWTVEAALTTPVRRTHGGSK